MMSGFESLVLGALQGFTELFPISSLGHSVLLPSLLGWHIDQHESFFVIFLVATHLATALVLVAFFWSDWMKIAAGFFRTVARGRVDSARVYERVAWLIIVATIPAGMLGLLLQKRIEELFATPTAVALFLIGNGVLLYGAELLRKRHAEKPSVADEDAAIASLPYLKAFGIGAMQALALLPGFSRTGAALAGGLLSGLSHGAAARFAFLLATPIIFAAAALKLPKLLTAGGYPLGELALGFLVSGITAWISITFLTKYFKTKTLMPFALYCIGAGALSLLILAF